MKKSFLSLFVFVRCLFGSMLSSASFLSSTKSAPAPHSHLVNLHAMIGLVTQPDRPNGNTYWVSNQLIAGEYPADKRGADQTRLKIGQYLHLGINCFIDLTHEGELEEYANILFEEAESKGFQGVEHIRLPIRDFGIPTENEMKTILDTIDVAIAEKKQTVYVHCRGGIGRTGTTVGCYLAKHGNSGSDALKEVNRLFKHSGRSEECSYSPETQAQMDFVSNWKS